MNIENPPRNDKFRGGHLYDCKIANTIGDHTQYSVGADASVRPLGITVSPQHFVKTAMRSAGRTGSSAPTGAYRFALVHSNLWRCTAREGGNPSPTQIWRLRANVAASQNVPPFSSSVSLREPPSPHGEGFGACYFTVRAKNLPQQMLRQISYAFFHFRQRRAILRRRWAFFRMKNTITSATAASVAMR